MIALGQCSGCGSSGLNRVGNVIYCDYCGARSPLVPAQAAGSSTPNIDSSTARSSSQTCNVCDTDRDLHSCHFCGDTFCVAHSKRWPDVEIRLCAVCTSGVRAEQLEQLLGEWNDLREDYLRMQVETKSVDFQVKLYRGRVKQLASWCLVGLGLIIGLTGSYLWKEFISVWSELVFVILPPLGSFVVYQRLLPRLVQAGERTARFYALRDSKSALERSIESIFIRRTENRRQQTSLLSGVNSVGADE
jgi:hypothetical protein